LEGHGSCNHRSVGVLVEGMLVCDWIGRRLSFAYLIDLSWRGTPRLLRMEPGERLVGLRECVVQYYVWYDVYWSSHHLGLEKVQSQDASA
jgi:hypothetical protein